MSTFAIVTLIWGSSSRGVTIAAKMPTSSATSANRGVMRAVRKCLAIRPAMPMARL